MIANQLLQQYQCLRNQYGYVTLPPRTLVALTGSDRAAFLHNFCTADIKALAEGQSTEAFVLDGRGKTLAHGLVIVQADRILYSVASASIAAALTEHLSKYVIREDVQIEDLSQDYESLFVVGDEMVARLPASWLLPLGTAAKVDIDDHSVLIAHVEVAGMGLLVLTPRAGLAATREWLQATGGLACDIEALEIIRTEAGTPWYGVEISSDNLPQELRRDAQSISFNKGCYLGQETVAKIDAIGHVNKFLVGIQLAASAPQPKPDEPVTIDGAAAGKTVSGTFSVVADAWLAFAYLKRQHASAGTEVTLGGQSGTVVDLPIKK